MKQQDRLLRHTDLFTYLKVNKELQITTNGTASLDLYFSFLFSHTHNSHPAPSDILLAFVRICTHLYAFVHMCGFSGAKPCGSCCFLLPAAGSSNLRLTCHATSRVPLWLYKQSQVCCSIGQPQEQLVDHKSNSSTTRASLACAHVLSIIPAPVRACVQTAHGPSPPDFSATTTPTCSPTHHQHLPETLQSTTFPHSTTIPIPKLM